MITIITVDEKYFTLDGIQFARIFQPLAQGSDAIGIYSIYDTKLQLVNSTKFDEFTIDGSTYANQALTIVALLEVIYSSNAIEDTIENKYPTTGAYRNYTDVIPQGNCKEKNFLNPYKLGTDIMAATFSSGNLQIGEYYRVTGTGAAITHDTVVIDEDEEFRATSTTFSVSSGNPVIKIGSQKALYEDGSQIYTSIILEVGDYYYMYYVGNTQKYDPFYGLGVIDANVSADLSVINGVGNTYRNNADYSRHDQIFLAYKLKSEGVYGGKWQKWEDGIRPIISVSGEYSGANDASNAWLRSAFYDGTQYVIFYIGDASQNGAAHDPKTMWATSADGITWTKQGSITTSGLDDVLVGQMFYANSTYYILRANSALNAIELWSNSSLAATGWTQIETDLISGYNRVYGVSVIDNVVYVSFRSIANDEKIELFSVPSANVATAASWVSVGDLFEMLNADSETTGEYSGQLTPGYTITYNNLLKVDTNKWAVFYSYYKNKMARYPDVRETNIRVLTFANSIPVPSE